MWQLNWTDTTLIDWHKLAEVLTYDPRQPMIFSSGVFLLLFLGFSFVYMLLQKRTTARLLFVTLFSYYFYYKQRCLFLSAGYCNGNRLLAGSRHGPHPLAAEAERACGNQSAGQPRSALLFQVYQFLL